MYFIFYFFLTIFSFQNMSTSFSTFSSLAGTHVPSETVNVNESDFELDIDVEDSDSNPQLVVSFKITITIYMVVV